MPYKKGDPAARVAQRKAVKSRADKFPTIKQARFIEVFDGNGTDAARTAEYSHPRQAAARLMKNPKVIAAIRGREKKRFGRRIADRKERQTFWTKVMHNPKETMKNRLKAAELLGKSQADFAERHILDAERGVHFKIDLSAPPPPSDIGNTSVGAPVGDPEDSGRDGSSPSTNVSDE